MSFISCSKKDGITIRGKIHGNFSITDEIEYTTPVNGTWFYGAKKTVDLDSLGNFIISLKTDVTSFITLYIPNKASAILLVEPDEKYEIDFYLNSKDQKVKIKGKSSEALTLYNSFALPEFYVLSNSNELLKDSLLATISSKITTLKKKEILQFQNYFENQNVTKDFYDLAELDRKYYYSALETSIAFINYKGDFDSNETQNAIWKGLFGISLPTDSFDIRSPWSFSLISNYIDFIQSKDEIDDFDKIREIYEQGKIHSYNINRAKKYLKGKVLEYYYATYILSNSYENKDNSKELITLFENFKKEYPNSNYTKHLKPQVQPIIDFHNKIMESTNNKKIYLVENYKSIDTFEELMKTLEGQKVLVDIWGTWCSPCKREFQEKDKSVEFLKSKKITTLYICEGKTEKKRYGKK
ncbi:TlpA family protein disulfide reductase [Mariniflexile gromovii]|uniref:Thioredoxin family protein n=2 Tax=Mariniflexile gromovii TaxID=362523 RepID=A0ABS4BRK8_9FLAO|nr:thioredoxin family protein [Mariniflexile gromovii]MBP0903209.1 thioredoxin family protein [Mariniflexile gromovii]